MLETILLLHKSQSSAKTVFWIFSTRLDFFSMFFSKLLGKIAGYKNKICESCQNNIIKRNHLTRVKKETSSSISVKHSVNVKNCLNVKKLYHGEDDSKGIHHRNRGVFKSILKARDPECISSYRAKGENNKILLRSSRGHPSLR